jgi:glycosyl transferase family 25
LHIDPALNFYLSGYFDRIFVVSVPRFAGRQEKLRVYLEGLSFDFFWGADKLQINIDQAKKDGTYNETEAIKLQRHAIPFNTGEIACSLSHRMVYEEMIRHNWQKVLILEDDVLPLYQHMPLLETVIKELPESWELVYLGYLKHEKLTAGLKLKQFFYKIASRTGLMKWSPAMISNMLPRPYSVHLKKAGFHDCTHAYALTLEAAHKLAAAQTPVVYRADDLLSNSIMKGDLEAYITVPKFFDQQDFHHSDIRSEIKESS